MKEKMLILKYDNGQCEIFIERDGGTKLFSEFIRLLKKQKTEYSIEFGEN